MGNISYEQGLESQAQCVESVKDQGTPVVIGCEHPFVITLGIRGKESEDLNTDLINSLDEQQKPQLVHAKRGGQATLHSPGQLVIYPIVNLRTHGLSVREYVHFLEETTLDLLRHIGLAAKRCPNEPGIIGPNGKLVAFGIRIQNGVASHGLAINSHNDLDLFKCIRSCGVPDRNHDRVSDHIHNVSNEILFELWTRYFSKSLPTEAFEWSPPKTEGLEITEVLPKD